MDPALRIAAGHHLDLDLDITRELTRVGHDVHVYSHVNIEHAPRKMFAAHAGLTPIFHVSPYYDSAGGVDAAAELERFKREADLLAVDLRNVRPAQLWIWPTLFASQHFACVVADPGVPIVGCLFMEPTYLNQTGKMLWRRSLTEAHDKGTIFDLGVVEATLHGEYLPLTVDGRLKTYPIPYDGSHVPRARERLTTIGFFGNQRDEKGVGLFERLITRLLDRGLHVVLHDSNDRSEGSSNGRFRLLLGFVQNLAAEIVGCDLVVAPYRPEEYRYKGSGIVWSALANGVPVVAPRGSAPGRLIESYGAGRLFDAFTPDSIFQSIMDAERDYAEISSAAREASLDWARVHGMGRFVEMLLSIET